MIAGLMPGAEWLPLLGEFAAKATLIMALAALAATLLWRASAAVRHLVWCAGVVGVLALPVFSVVLPAWEVAVLPADAAPAPQLPAATKKDAAPQVPVAPIASASTTTPTAAVSAPREAWLPRAATGLAAAGMMAGLLWLVLGFWGVARIGRRAQVVRDPEWLRTVHEAADQLGLRRPVLLLRHRGTVMPATGGLLWPSVVLPVNADQWSADRRRAVLAHELAHVKRYDTLTQALAQVACALFWWHPAVWYAARRLRVERERACDDLVLRSGTRASDYAAHLLEIARAHRTMRLASPAMVSMARPSHLESRLLWVLDAARARGVPSATASVLTVLAALLVVGPLAAMRPIQAIGGSASAMTVLEPGKGVKAYRGTASYRQETGLDAALDTGVPGSGKDGMTAAEIGREARLDAMLDAVYDSRDAARDAAHDGSVDNRLAGTRQALAQVDTPPAGRSVEDLIAMRAVGVDAEYIAGMRDAGYPGLRAQQLIGMRAVGVTPSYAEEMNAVGWGRLTSDQLTGMRAVGVTSAWLENLRRAGAMPRSADEATGMKALGVNGDYVAELAAAGYTGVDGDGLAGLRATGVNAEYVRELAAAGLQNVPAEQLTGLRAVGVTGEYVRELRAAGLTGRLDADDLTDMKAVGVTGAYIRELRAAGLTELSIRDLTDLRAHRVTAAYVRDLREAGFDPLTAQQVVRLKASGVDDELMESRRRSRRNP